MISDLAYDILAFDLPAIGTALCASIACALLGAILVLRKQSLMGDAIAHSVLPGIVISFLITGQRSSIYIFIGAAVAGVVAALLIGILRTLGRIDIGASMGVVFSLFFALGVVLIEQAAARNVDLDADCLLHGQLEHIFWFPPKHLLDLIQLHTWISLPNEFWVSLGVLVLVAIAIVLLFKEWKLIAFDLPLARSLGFPVHSIEIFFLVLLATAVVASFYVVGSILVIAMLICPGATARMYTDRFHSHIVLSVFISICTVLLGYSSAAWLPIYLGYENSLSAAGMISVWGGLILISSVVLAPKYGLIGRLYRQLEHRIAVEAEDILAYLYRKEYESSARILPTQSWVDSVLRNKAYRLLVDEGYIQKNKGGYILTDKGKYRGLDLVRHHRQWEHYLVDSVGLRADHVHERAMQLEHLVDAGIASQLDSETKSVSVDPHGKTIPKK